jgi:hypothetical protein
MLAPPAAAAHIGLRLHHDQPVLLHIFVAHDYSTHIRSSGRLADHTAVPCSSVRQAPNKRTKRGRPNCSLDVQVQPVSPPVVQLSRAYIAATGAAARRANDAAPPRSDAVAQALPQALTADKTVEYHTYMRTRRIDKP